MTPGVPFLTLRSDGFDLYAQPDGAIVFHKPGMALNVTADGPALKGATNVLLGQVDHRDTALSPVAFAEIYRFITGRAPSRIAITPEPEVVLNGRVTGVVAGTPTNRPVEGAKVDVYRVSADTGERQGAAALSRTTGADGVWGPATFDPTTALEFVVAAPGAPVTHIYRSPLPRSFAQLDLRPAARWRRRIPTRPRSFEWIGRAAISACRAISCCSTARSRPTFPMGCPRPGIRR